MTGCDCQMPIRLYTLMCLTPVIRRSSQKLGWATHDCIFNIVTVDFSLNARRATFFARTIGSTKSQLDRNDDAKR